MNYLLRSHCTLLCSLLLIAGQCSAAEKNETVEFPINAKAVNGKRLAFVMRIPPEFCLLSSENNHYLTAHQYILKSESSINQDDVSCSFIVRTRLKIVSNDASNIANVDELVNKFKFFLDQRTCNSHVFFESLREKDLYKTIKLASVFTYDKKRIVTYLSFYEGIDDFSGFEYGAVLPKDKPEIESMLEILDNAQKFEQENVSLQEY